MNVLVIGARGFVGAATCARLRAAGHRVVEAVSARHGGGADRLVVDLAADRAPAAWLPRLAGIDAVVNAAGVLRDRAGRPIAAIHAEAPIALFEACAEAGVRRVVQVSALGIAGVDIAYARTKRAADARLAELTRAGRLDGVVVQPSLVFGAGGASSRLFLALARLPALLLPRPVLHAQVQPVAVGELAQVLAALVEAPAVPAVVAAVGPQAVTLAGFIASLRAQAGRAPARVGALPDALARLGARLGDAVPVAPWCSETLALLGQDNTAAPQAFERLLGRPATRYDALLRPHAP
jgi:uncharacterized protein YbjT (DUF2867 family)